jgi:autophagy-related protein 101
VRGRIAVEFYEKKRRRSNMWFPALAGMEFRCNSCYSTDGIWYVEGINNMNHLANPFPKLERAKVRKAMENMLQKAALKILAVVNRDKDHIPPITTTESNPFPYRIILNPRTDGWQNRFGLY